VGNDLGFFRLFVRYVSQQYERIFSLVLEHLYISIVALLITLSVCIPLGIYLTRKERFAPYVIGMANVFQTIPSIALLGFLILIFGIGNDNAIFALFLYAMLPVLQNTYIGIKGVSPSLVQAAKGMGMTNIQILLKVELPLALPVIIGGIRVATVWTIGTAALAAAIGGGGLGRLIFSGLASIRNEVIVAGALPATLMALLADQGLKAFQAYMTPERRVERVARKMEKQSKKEVQLLKKDGTAAEVPEV
jgi:osmoprotectant transport system permease protein